MKEVVLLGVMEMFAAEACAESLRVDAWKHP